MNRSFMKYHILLIAIGLFNIRNTDEIKISNFVFSEYTLSRRLRMVFLSKLSVLKYFGYTVVVGCVSNFISFRKVGAAMLGKDESVLVELADPYSLSNEYSLNTKIIH